MNRRRFLKHTSAVATVAAAKALLPYGSAGAQGSGEVIVSVGTGDWMQSNVKAYVEPFKAETGIDVVQVEDWFALSKLKLWNENKNTEWDVANIGGSDLIVAFNRGWIEPIDYSIYTEAGKLDPKSKHAGGVGALFYSTVLAYWPEAFPDGKAPADWAEFWDVKRFPQKRTLVGGEYGYGSWEFAALADGVPIDKLYPLDIERAFKKLEEIKPHILKWWTDGSDNQQIFADKFVDMGSAYNGRMGNLLKQGLGIKMNWNQAKLEQDFWGIPKGCPNLDNAQKFIEFATRGKQQAIFAENIPYGPTNLSAYDYLAPEIAKQLPSYPANLSTQFYRDYAWEAETGAGGKSNLEVLIERWNKFAAG